MIKSTFGLTREPFYRSELALLAQQAEAVEMIKIHAQHGGFSVIVGNPGVGKSEDAFTLIELLEQLRDVLAQTYGPEIMAMMQQVGAQQEAAQTPDVDVPF